MALPAFFQEFEKKKPKDDMRKKNTLIIRIKTKSCFIIEKIIINSLLEPRFKCATPPDMPYVKSASPPLHEKMMECLLGTAIRSIHFILPFYHKSEV